MVDLAIRPGLTFMRSGVGSADLSGRRCGTNTRQVVWAIGETL